MVFNSLELCFLNGLAVDFYAIPSVSKLDNVADYARAAHTCSLDVEW
jgi:hypothetical protein